MFKTYRGQCNVDFIFHQIITNSKIFYYFHITDAIKSNE